MACEIKVCLIVSLLLRCTCYIESCISEQEWSCRFVNDIIKIVATTHVAIGEIMDCFYRGLCTEDLWI